MEREKVTMKLREILSQSDLTQLTRKLVRERLEAEMHINLSNHKWKEFLKNEIKSFIESTAQHNNIINTNTNNNNNNNINTNTKISNPFGSQINNLTTTTSTTAPTTTNIDSSAHRRQSNKRRYKEDDDDNDNDMYEDNEDESYDEEKDNTARAVKIRKLNNEKSHNTKYDKMVEKSNFSKIASSSSPTKKNHNNSKDKNLSPTSLQEKFASFIGDQKNSFQYDAREKSYFMKLPTPGLKRIIVHKFKGKCYVDFREYFEKDGQEIPTKKGAHLTIAEWRAFCNAIDEINKYLEKVKRQ